MAAGGQGGHIRVEAQGADIIDNGGAGRQGGPGHRGLVGVDGDGDGDFRGQGGDDRDDPAQFLFQGHGFGIGPGGFAAHVQDIGAGGHQLPGVGQGHGRVEMGAMVGKGIRGDVEDAHDEGPGWSEASSSPRMLIRQGILSDIRQID